MADEEEGGFSFADAMDGGGGEEEGFSFADAMGGGEEEEEGGFSFADAMGGGGEEEEGGFSFADALGGGEEEEGGFSFADAMGGGGGDDDDFSNPAMGGADDVPPADAAGGGAAMNSVDLLSSLLAGADMEDAIKKEPEKELEPEKPKKKPNKKKKKKDPKAMMKALKEAQNASDAGGAAAVAGGAVKAIAHSASSWPKLRPADAEFKTIVVDSGRSKWRIGLEGEAEPRFISAEAGSDAADLGSRWAELEVFLEEHCGGVDAAVEHAVLFTVPVLEDPSTTQRHVEMATVALGDRFKFARCCIAAQEVLCMYASGVPTGVVVNLGVSVTCVPIWEGCILESGICRMDDVPAAWGPDAPFDLDTVSVLTDLVLSSVMSSPIDTRSQLFSNIVIAGEGSAGWGEDQMYTLERYLERAFSRCVCAGVFSPGQRHPQPECRLVLTTAASPGCIMTWRATLVRKRWLTSRVRSQATSPSPRTTCVCSGAHSFSAARCVSSVERMLCRSFV